jgi:hypothetical protein
MNAAIALACERLHVHEHPSRIFNAYLNAFILFLRQRVAGALVAGNAARGITDDLDSSCFIHLIAMMALVRIPATQNVKQ